MLKLKSRYLSHSYMWDMCSPQQPPPLGGELQTQLNTAEWVLREALGTIFRVFGLNS